MDTEGGREGGKKGERELYRSEGIFPNLLRWKSDEKFYRRVTREFLASLDSRCLLQPQSGHQFN